jgi:hypothetical protein
MQKALENSRLLSAQRATPIQAWKGSQRKKMDKRWPSQKLKQATCKWLQSGLEQRTIVVVVHAYKGGSKWGLRKQAGLQMHGLIVFKPWVKLCCNQMQSWCSGGKQKPATPTLTCSQHVLKSMKVKPWCLFIIKQ